MKGVFFQTKAPLLIRDELRYNPGFKDSLQQTVEQEEFKRRRMSNTPKEAYEEKPVPVPTYQPQMRYNKREVVGKVTEKPLDQDFSAYNYRGFQSNLPCDSDIKTKQVHGFDIIKNF